MENKTKDTVFSVMMMLLGGYVVVEGVKIVRKAALPPYNIKTFSVSPGFLPVILGVALIVFSIILLIKTLVGEKNAGVAFVRHFKTFFASFVAAFRNPGVLRMIGGVMLMAVLTFVLLGLVPFWIGGTLFMIAMMFFLRATKWWMILLTSSVAMGLTVLLFQVCFKTTLP